MSGRGKIVLLAVVVATGAAAGGGYWYSQREDLPAVDAERITRRPLEAIVSASGTIEPQVSVDISASVMGRVTRLGVNEGDRVSAGQFLLQIDPESLQSAVDRGQASLQAAESSRDQARVAVTTAEVNLDLARDNLERQRELWELRLVSREVYDQAVSEVELRESELRAREVDVATNEQRIRQEAAVLDSAEYDLTQVTIVSPMNGIVTRRSIELGETVVVGTMNNAGTVLLVDEEGHIVDAPSDGPDTVQGGVTPAVEAFSVAEGGNLEELEGVFLLRDGRVHFTRVETGIAGERYFESLSGLEVDDLVVTGPFNVVRNLEHGDSVQLEDNSDEDSRSGFSFGSRR